MKNSGDVPAEWLPTVQGLLTSWLAVAEAGPDGEHRVLLPQHYTFSYIDTRHQGAATEIAIGFQHDQYPEYQFEWRCHNVEALYDVHTSAHPEGAAAVISSLLFESHEGLGRSARRFRTALHSSKPGRVTLVGRVDLTASSANVGRRFVRALRRQVGRMLLRGGTRH
jgi:hypothetical protein